MLFIKCELAATTSGKPKWYVTANTDKGIKSVSVRAADKEQAITKGMDILYKFG